MSQLETRAPSHGSQSAQGSRVLSFEAEEVTGVFDCLSSGTARNMLAALHEEPRTASELATLADTSIQNVRYHLDKFENGNLVEVVDTEPSSRGLQMDVYGPTHTALVLYAGDGDTAGDPLHELLRGVLSAVGVLGVLSLLIRILIPLVFRGGMPGDAAGGLTDPLVIYISGTAIAAGLVFFAGGLLVLGVMVAIVLVKSNRALHLTNPLPP